MRKFPKEFADLLSPKGRAILTSGYAHANRIFHSNVTPLALLTGVIDVKKGVACSQLLNRKMYEHVRRVEAPIPPESISGMRKNYEERLPKTMRFKTAYFSSTSSLSYKAAAEIGLIEMMRSESFAAFAEAITDLKLERDPGIQAILYESGDYAGPHNDHHPENENAQRGFVDVHISLTNTGVASQYLVHEERGHFSRMYSVSINGAVAVYKLPFWHFTTPLQAKKQMEREARRWLLLGSFDIKPESSRKRGNNGRSARGHDLRSR